MLIGNVEDVVGGERDVGGLALHDLVERNGDFVLGAGAFPAVDVGLLAGEGHQAFGQRQHLQDGGIAAILHGEGAGLLHVADDVDLADFGDADLFAAGELDVEGGIGVVDQAAHVDAAREHDGRAIGAGLGLADQDFAAGIFAETLGAGDGLQQGGGAFGLEDEGHLDGAGDADGAAVVLGDGDGDEGIDQDLLLPEGLGDGGLEFGAGAAFRLDALLQHGEADEAVAADADGAAQLGRVVDRDGDQVVGADGLGREIGADFGDRNRAVGVGRLRRSAGGEKQDWDQQTHNVSFRSEFANCSSWLPAGESRTPPRPDGPWSARGRSTAGPRTAAGRHMCRRT